ncbi:dnaJ homolog subfamily C member 8-like [Paramacrobiotus metropolitanus]|uniref:dnaJ homolog subfamily C member 8-like n=1 Tax=Paramacrobiotus metropolitanus TaxID=2943436 RepID=UPI002445DE18|nr:dnaJ homolog subfamily C member 8-like [Paramacrobiotus metropolitanus]
MSSFTEDSSAAGPAESSGAPDEVLQSFFTEVKEIEKQDSKLTPKQQIDRLCRPGSTYANLNPFDVLQVTPETPLDEIKKQFRRLSILVHPDKNPDDDRAQKAFDAVAKAWKVLEIEEGYKKCMEIVEEAKGRTDQMIKEKKKKLRKEGKSGAVEEDDPEKYKHAVYVLTMKLFADLERKRREQETKNAHEKKRKHLEEEEAKEKEKDDKEWQKNFEASRTQRVDSWRTFQTKKTTGDTARPTKPLGYKPPKHKAEQREAKPS